MKNLQKNFFQKSSLMRIKLFKKFYSLKEGHPGSVFSIIDILIVLYYGGFVKFKKKGKKKIPFDDVIMSKGHATVGQYPILHDLGVISDFNWKNWNNNKNKSSLRMFGNSHISGIKASTGSLGHGIGFATGIGFSSLKKKKNKKIFVIISEGELYEGSTWESFFLLSSLKLPNVYIILDINNNIILGNPKKCLPLGNIKKKIESFNIKTFACNGHNFKEINLKLKKMKKINGPTCLIAKTIKGKGLKMMENKPQWHYWNDISVSEYNKSINELKNK